MKQGSYKGTEMERLTRKSTVSAVATFSTPEGVAWGKVNEFQDLLQLSGGNDDVKAE
jgi:hypothetical protein